MNPSLLAGLTVELHVILFPNYSAGQEKHDLHEQIPIPDSTKTLTRWDLSSLNKPLLHSLRLFMKHLHYSWELGMSKTKQLASTHPRAHGPF